MKKNYDIIFLMQYINNNFENIQKVYSLSQSKGDWNRIVSNVGNIKLALIRNKNSHQ